jgi:succinoglycan biosynthesis protein ExoU
VIVVYDASAGGGGTLAEARAADDGSWRLKVLALERNTGHAAAWNAAIAASRASWICVLGSDDFMQPGRLGKQPELTGAGQDLIADDLLQTREGEQPTAAKLVWFRKQPDPFDVSFGAFVESNVTKASRMRREMGLRRC